jgi:hypothetical protein
MNCVAAALLLCVSQASGGRFFGRRSLLAVPALPLALEAYSRVPPLTPPDEPAPPLVSLRSAPPSDLVVILPGAGGPDANTARIAAALQLSNRVYKCKEKGTLRACEGAGGSLVVEYDWRKYKGDELRAPYDALRLGTRLGSELGRLPEQPRSIHLVGVSVGAFLADAIAESYVATAGRGRANVHMTLCDAFTARGLAGLARPTTAYGVARFGRSADYCESILNTDDPVPSTASVLRHAVTFDVTAAASRRGFVPLPGDSLHSWPAAWYGLFGANSRPAMPVHGANGLMQRGAVVQVG